MIRTIRTIVVTTALIALSSASAEAGWEFREFMNPQGDQGTGITLAPSNATGVRLAFGCEGDRWRQVAILPEPPNPMRLASDGRVALGFKPDQLTPDGKWKVRAAGENRAYFAPSATQFMGRLYRAEEADPNAVLYVKLRPAKKAPMTLEFPIAGLRRALAKHLWTACKLDIYFGSPDSSD